MILWHLCNLQQSSLPFVIDDCPTLDVRLGLIGDFHDVFSLSVDHGLHDVKVDNGTEIVNVGDEDVFFAGGYQLVEETRVAVLGN
jgi:hypothetical protein